MFRTRIGNWLDRLYGENENPNNFMQLLAVNGLAATTPVFGPNLEAPAHRDIVGEMNEALTETLALARTAHYDFFTLLSETGKMKAEEHPFGVHRGTFVNLPAGPMAGAANDNATAGDVGPVRVA